MQYAKRHLHFNDIYKGKLSCKHSNKERKQLKTCTVVKAYLSSTSKNYL